MRQCFQTPSTSSASKHPVSCPIRQFSPHSSYLAFVLCSSALLDVILWYLSGLLCWFLRIPGYWAVLIKVVLKFSYLYLFNVWNYIHCTWTLLKGQFWASICQTMRKNLNFEKEVLLGWQQFLFVLLCGNFIGFALLIL